ncbi:hypothetical protein HZC21_00400 [Candidatus Peregrinibacteria bacterium]|nr:hypothetical protein [Candidatus Peregrinibacteria bacterium]
MKDKHTKNWLIGMIVALMIVGAGASLYSKTTFFKGTGTLNIEKAFKNANAQASVLNAEPKQRDFSKIIEQNEARINTATPAPELPKSPCALGEITVWQYGKFAGCEKPPAPPSAATQEPPKSPGPKITIIK